MMLEALVHTASMAAEKLFNQHGSVGPLYFMIQASGESIITAPPSPEDKDLSAAMMRAIMELRDVVRYVLVNEAWTITAIGDDGRLSGVEVLMLACEDQREGQQLYRRLIIREPGKQARLGPLVRDEYPESEGRMVGMLPRPQGARIQ